jgi:hypothetical protein
MGHVLTRDDLQGYALTVNISYVILLMTMRLTSYENTFKYESICTESICYNLQNLISLSKIKKFAPWLVCGPYKKEYGFG